MVTTARTALVTGASSGIGAAFAAQLAEQGTDLVLVARSSQRLAALAADLEGRFGVVVRIVALDLSQPDSSERLFQRLTDDDVRIDFLVNNAGASNRGAVASADPAELAAEVELNVGAVVGITARLLPGMIERGHGVIVNVASSAAFQPAPYLAVYAATKAFVLSFTQALWGETRETGVRVLALCPGPTDTAMLRGVADGESPIRPRTPEQVVTTALKALESSKPSVVDGTASAVIARVVPRFVPERALIRATARMTRPATVRLP